MNGGFNKTINKHKAPYAIKMIPKVSIFSSYKFAFLAYSFNNNHVNPKLYATPAKNVMTALPSSLGTSCNSMILAAQYPGANPNKF